MISKFIAPAFLSFLLTSTCIPAIGMEAAYDVEMASPRTGRPQTPQGNNLSWLRRAETQYHECCSVLSGCAESTVRPLNLLVGAAGTIMAFVGLYYQNELFVVIGALTTPVVLVLSGAQASFHDNIKTELEMENSLLALDHGKQAQEISVFKKMHQDIRSALAQPQMARFTPARAQSDTSHGGDQPRQMTVLDHVIVAERALHDLHRNGAANVIGQLRLRRGRFVERVMHYSPPPQRQERGDTVIQVDDLVPVASGSGDNDPLGSAWEANSRAVRPAEGE